MAIDPEAIIAAALAVGAAAVAKTIATDTVRDAYNALKSKIQRKSPKVHIARIESAPESVEIRHAAHEELKELNVGQDAEILGLARVILDMVQAPEVAAAIGVDLESIRAASLTIENVMPKVLG
jgi:hypothetical protein